MAAVTICSDFGAPKNKVSHQNLVCTRTQEKGAVTPQETNSDMVTLRASQWMWQSQT